MNEFYVARTKLVHSSTGWPSDSARDRGPDHQPRRRPRLSSCPGQGKQPILNLSFLALLDDVCFADINAKLRAIYSFICSKLILF